MDVVYIVRPGDQNEELRYSLRSVAANLRHGRIWVVGHRPPWLTNVTNIVTTQGDVRSDIRHANTLAAWRHVATHPGISETCLLMNDDMFIMHAVGRVPVFHRGAIDDWVRHRSTASSTAGATRAVETRELLAHAGLDPAACLAYELHHPLPVHRPTLAEALDYAENLRPHQDMAQCLAKRTWYGNWGRVGGTQVEDCKIRSDAEWLAAGGATEVSRWPYLSTDDSAFDSGAVGKLIRARFPDPSPHEIPGHDRVRPERGISMLFVSEKHPELSIPTIGVRFRAGRAEVTTRGAVAYLGTPQMRRRGVRPATAEEVRQLDTPDVTPAPKDAAPADQTAPASPPPAGSGGTPAPPPTSGPGSGAAAWRAYAAALTGTPAEGWDGLSRAEVIARLDDRPTADTDGG